ncbi:transposase zinc-binding domain-containing protein [Morganella sp. EGD-HP17]|uniref:transposase zinc-binding domain-containing protein n=1 Tax=Morganella sp. EGD-HP17 TaxID=1435146 RepID=UPI0004256F67|nr:hypothetical protein X965_13020 [Morganella sp. EGD-HP17]
MKVLFQRNGVWADLLETCPLRETEVEVVTKMLACGTLLLGTREFHCDNPDCTHQRLIHQSCKGRGCPVCGKKATDMWIANRRWCEARSQLCSQFLNIYRKTSS